DNGGLPGTNTGLDVSQLAELRILGGAYVTSSLPNLSLTTLLIGTNATFQIQPFTSSAFFLTVVSNATIAGTFSADGGAASAPGNGLASQTGARGGSHGGLGGRGLGGNAGVIYFDSMATPSLGGGRGGSSEALG